MKYLVALSVYYSCYVAYAFVSLTPLNSRKVSLQQTALLVSLPSPDESAKAFTDYMTKSHEDKLKAIKAVEDKKNAEIKVCSYMLYQISYDTLSKLTYSILYKNKL